MLELARSGATEGLWLRAERQTGGRGRQGRAWESPPGNFYGSTLIRVRPGDPGPATLALVAAVALEEAISTFRHPGESRDPEFRAAACVTLGPGFRRDDEVVIKWPNDLLIDGAKLSGILLERTGDAVVIGFGVNLAHHPENLERPTTSLAAHGATVAPEIFADVLAESVARWIAKWREGLGPVRERWLARAHPIGTALTARLSDGSAIDGLFQGLDADGALTLRLADGTSHVIHAADVFLI
ncbi:biotin--[acetyl-CoA-carboxylase] ligase [Sphingomonas sp. LB-2]|uniref:biotin--[acetyl-CoA-carboxylase] ligase n=1 Tax=Sphingomonas caeni TaxID=2984949 RepID=UPI00222EE21E|nr:biotin--[acetyl-CoA-carboxylase] ligase [Sphingomonas caeni]MCW3847843.1 biotin--[acetyl-CoA-carboxylase] ligase [Sphingomonas caeni]